MPFFNFSTINFATDFASFFVLNDLLPEIAGIVVWLINSLLFLKILNLPKL